MKRILRSRPSPALVISLVALFVALGGTAYALTITGANVINNSLTGADVRDVKGVDIRNYSVAGKDIGKDSLGRVPIKEERLDSKKIGEVKLATDTRTFAGLTPRRVQPFTLDANAAPRELHRAGPFVISARCRTAAGDQFAEVIVQSTVAGTAVQGNTDTANLPANQEGLLLRSTAATGTPSLDQEADGLAVAPDGTEVFTRDLYAGTSLFGEANKCRFGGVLYTG